MKGFDQVWSRMNKKQILDEFILKEVYQCNVDIISEKSHDNITENPSLSILKPKKIEES